MVTFSTDFEAGAESFLCRLEVPLAPVDHAVEEVILMKLYNNLSFTEIASTLGTTYEAARFRYRRGIKYAASRIMPDLLHN